MEQQIVTKTEFAALTNVSNSAVSQWIKRGHLTAPAIVKTPRGDRIDVSAARAQLRARLDPNQRFGLNGLTTNLDGAASSAEAPLPARMISASAIPFASDTVEAQIKAEKLRQAQLMTSRLEEEDRARRGLYVDAAAASAEMTRVAAEMLRTFEGALTDIASALAGKFTIPQRDALHLMRAEFRAVRDRMAKTYAAAAAAAEPFVEADKEPDRSPQDE